MIEGYAIESGSLCHTSGDDASVWLCIAPDAAEQLTLQERLGISTQAMASSLDPDEVARIEIKPDHLFVIWKRPESFDGRAFNVSSFGVILSESD